MGFFGSLLGDIGKGIADVATIGGDVLTGNFGAAAGNAAKDIGGLFSSSSPKPSSAKKPTFSLPGSTGIGTSGPGGFSNFLGQGLQIAPHISVGGHPAASPMLPAATAAGGFGSTGSYGSGSSLVPTGQANLFMETRYRAAPGYVVVRYGGNVYAVPREQAIHLRDPQTGKRLWHAAKKPPISVREWESAKRFKMVEKKIKRVAEHLDLKTEHKGIRRSAPRPRKAVTDAIIVKET